MLRHVTKTSGRRDSNPPDPSWQKGAAPSGLTRKVPGRLSAAPRFIVYQLVLAGPSGAHVSRRGGVTRTRDPLLPKQVRYQLRYTSKKFVTKHGTKRFLLHE